MAFFSYPPHREMSVPLHPDMKKITTFAIFIAIALSAPAQETRKLGIAEMFELIEHNKPARPEWKQLKRASWQHVANACPT